MNRSVQICTVVQTVLLLMIERIFSVYLRWPCVLFSPKEGVYIKEDNSTTPCEVWKLHKQPQTSKSFPSPPELPSARASTQIHLQPPQEASNIVEGPNIQRSVHHQAASSTMKDHRPPPCDGMEGKKYPPPPVTIQLMTGERCCCRQHHQCVEEAHP
jgi:hypothetical protein